MPAGTGVCVVNTVPARTASSASSKVSPLPSDQLADPLHAEEPGVALVGVEHLRRRRPGGGAVGPDRPHAADAEQHLLLQPVLLAAAVEPVGDLRAGSSFSSMSQSSSSSGTRPTWATQTWAHSVRPSGSARAIRTGAPSASCSTRIGRPCGSSDG